jgi:hypothetical protein
MRGEGRSRCGEKMAVGDEKMDVWGLGTYMCFVASCSQPDTPRPASCLDGV